ncbi:MAG: hypothetical protein ABIE74_03950 [Pseudomonadota bacterium]
MKFKKLSKNIFLLSILAFIGMTSLVTFGAHAQTSDEEDHVMLDSLRKMRSRQQNEEQRITVRKFVTQTTQKKCTPVQQARQRMREIERGNGTHNEEVTINAGHEELNVTDNHGTINSDINIQIIKQGGDEDECL